MQTLQIATPNKQRDSRKSFFRGWRNWVEWALEIASGTGDPVLNIASIVYIGTMTKVDLLEQILEIPWGKADEEITKPNTQVVDVWEVPLEGASFDSVSCGLGFMYFPDLKFAARAIRRLLKRWASVWGAPGKNLGFTAMIAVVRKYVDWPTTSVDTFGVFLCGQPSLKAPLCEEAGMIDVVKSGINGWMVCSSADEFWGIMNDLVLMCPQMLRSFLNEVDITSLSLSSILFLLLSTKFSRKMCYQAMKIMRRFIRQVFGS